MELSNNSPDTSHQVIDPWKNRSCQCQNHTFSQPRDNTEWTCCLTKRHAAPTRHGWPIQLSCRHPLRTLPFTLDPARFWRRASKWDLLGETKSDLNSIWHSTYRSQLRRAAVSPRDGRQACPCTPNIQQASEQDKKKWLFIKQNPRHCPTSPAQD